MMASPHAVVNYTKAGLGQRQAHKKQSIEPDGFHSVRTTAAMFFAMEHVPSQGPKTLAEVPAVSPVASKKMDLHGERARRCSSIKIEKGATQQC